MQLQDQHAKRKYTKRAVISLSILILYSALIYEK